jgi:4-aminobutyrate aminotransferase-like enzyme
VVQGKDRSVSPQSGAIDEADMRNSPTDAERDIRFHLHAQTNPASHEDTGPLIITRGDGPYVFDSEGRRYLDAMAGLWSASLGFGHPRLKSAAAEAYEAMGFYHTFGGRSSPAAIDAAEAIANLAPIEEVRIFFATSGSEANETMVKLAWLYHAANGEPGRRKIIARKRSFHGSTIVTASLTGLPHMHREFGLPLPGFLHTEAPDLYRGLAQGETIEQYEMRLAADLERLILSERPDTIAAMIAEPVQAGAGVLVPAGYFPKIQAVLDRYGILMLDDEVVCGFGRTGRWFGCESVGMKPDMMSMAKGLSSRISRSPPWRSARASLRPCSASTRRATISAMASRIPAIRSARPSSVRRSPSTKKWSYWIASRPSVPPWSGRSVRPLPTRLSSATSGHGGCSPARSSPIGPAKPPFRRR